MGYLSKPITASRLEMLQYAFAFFIAGISMMLGVQAIAQELPITEDPVQQLQIESIKTLEDITDQKIKLKTIELMASTTLSIEEATQQYLQKEYEQNNTDRIIRALNKIELQLRETNKILRK